jgi:hypothetical protein
MRQIWIPGIVAIAIAGCASGTMPDRTEDIAAQWRHPDGTGVSSTEIAQARTDCTRASAREATAAEAGLGSNPAYNPGGEGLINAPPGSVATDRVDSPTSWVTSQTAIPLADCLEAQGLVPAQ